MEHAMRILITGKGKSDTMNASGMSWAVGLQCGPVQQASGPAHNAAEEGVTSPKRNPSRPAESPMPGNNWRPGVTTQGIPQAANS
jgi:hypothetical protein